MGTVGGVNTRRYHALLTASLRPPAERFVTLARVDEDAIVAGETYSLGACQYPGVVAPRGYQYLEEFCAEPCATWRYRCGGATIEKQVYLVPDRQAVMLRYRASVAATLRVRPFLAFRDYHSLARRNDTCDLHAGEWAGVVRMQPYSGLPALEFHSPGQFTSDPHWYENIEYLVELERGLDHREDLFTPGVLALDLEAGEWTTICASLDGTQGGDPLEAKRDPFVIRRADATPTIFAGYPWFTEWGRDTMVALPGLLIVPGRLAEARQILELFLKHRDRGVIPNRFSETGEAPEYNTADATLWMFQAMRMWLAAGGDRAFLRDVFYPAAKDIVRWHFRGTWHGIRADPSDGLLIAGTPGTQLTWMDAKAGDWVATPRHGKPVEVNALWHGALCSMTEWAGEVGDRGWISQCGQAADRARASFREKFWSAERGCLFDIVRDDGNVDKIRPNQIFAVSLPYDLLDLPQQQAIVRTVSEKLLTQVGLRTLARDDPDYRPRYEGPPQARDGAYHNGTVWPWLIGPYIDAYLRAFGLNSENTEQCRALIRGIEEEAAWQGCVDSFAEIYDGDHPHHPRGCPAQAWSVAEIARVRGAYGL